MIKASARRSYCTFAPLLLYHHLIKAQKMAVLKAKGELNSADPFLLVIHTFFAQNTVHEFYRCASEIRRLPVERGVALNP